MWYAVIVVLMAMTCLDRSYALAVSADERESLRGLPGVQVVIENIRRDAQADGLLEDSVRTAVELILRSSGIPILTHSERSKTLSAPFLYVEISTNKNKAGLYAIATRISLEQRVLLAGSTEHTMFAATWKDYGVGTSGPSNISKTTDHVESAVKAFANDFLSVNPR
jgi:hypothetical protein